MREVVIISIARTPIGSFLGSLSSVSATKLGAAAIKEAISRAGISPSLVEEVYMGNVLSAGLGQAPATQAATFAGIPDTVPSTTINKVCASGMKAIMLASQSIALGQREIIIAGGMESMSNVPYYIDKARSGYRLGHGQLIDGMLKDGLWDVYNDYHMGNAAELCARECNISRAEQDEFAISSYQRSQKAIENGKFKQELVPVEFTIRGKINVIDTDEEPSQVNFDKISGLKPVFDKEGSVTAANASSLNDGASAVVLMSAEKAAELGLRPLARILGYADAQQAPEWFTTSPAKAIPLALKMAGKTLADVDFFEINEAFSVVAIANNNLLKIDPEKVNIYGGAVSLGHPLGSSGSRIIVTLCSILKQEGGKIGVAGICNGGGGASAMVIENLDL